jgi:signal transduction histidine kinase
MLVYAFTTQRISKMEKTAVVADTLIKGASELNILIHEYVQHPGERPRIQWLSKHQTLTELLTTANSANPQDRDVFKALHRKLKGTKTLFVDLVATYPKEEGQALGSGLSTEWQDRLVGQILTESLSLVSDSQRLLQANLSGLVETQKRADQMVLGTSLVLLTAMIIITFSVSSHVAKSIGKLQKGTEILADGNLNLRFDIDRNDEIGQLALAFNVMTEKLKKSYALLEEENAERKQAQEALEELNETLEQHVAARTEQLETARQVSLQMMEDAENAAKETERANESLKKEIAKRSETEEKLRNHQQQLQSLSSELFLTEQRERQQLAADLHDGLGQLLALVEMKLGMLQDESTRQELESAIQVIAEHIREAHQVVRSLIYQISPPILHELGLPAAVEWLAEDIEDRYGISIALQRNGSLPDLDNPTRVVLFRGTRELLINVAKHAEASLTSVNLESLNGSYWITVEDDGVGFEPEEILDRTGGVKFGLMSIRERLIHIGGSMDVQSTPGEGTKVTITAPVHCAQQLEGDA